MQLTEYLYIYKTRNCSEHWHVNRLIGQNNLWGEFNILHSLNTHASGYRVDGIWPQYFAIICKALQITSSGGSQLLNAESPEEEKDVLDIYF